MTRPTPATALLLAALGTLSFAAPVLAEWAPGVVLDLCGATGMRARFAARKDR